MKRIAFIIGILIAACLMADAVYADHTDDVIEAGAFCDATYEVSAAFTAKQGDWQSTVRRVNESVWWHRFTAELVGKETALILSATDKDLLFERLLAKEISRSDIAKAMEDCWRYKLDIANTYGT